MKPDIAPDQADQPKSRATSVSNAMRLIKLFSDERYEIGLIELSAQLDLSKSTVHRLLSTLVETGMLVQDAQSGKYRLGLIVFELGALMQRKMRVTDNVRPFLVKVHDYQ